MMGEGVVDSERMMVGEGGCWEAGGGVFVAGRVLGAKMWETGREGDKGGVYEDAEERRGAQVHGEFIRGEM